MKLNKLHGHKLPMGVLSAALLPDDGLRDDSGLIAGCMDGVYLTSIEENAESKRLYQHESYVSSVEVIDENTIVSAGYDGAACWFDLKTESEVRRKKLHEFWSWDMVLSPDRKLLASVTGQYLAGGYKYEPKAESEPCIRVLDSATGEVLQNLSHVPSVQAVAITPDNQHVAAGNLMGEIRVYRISDGKLLANWTTPDFTSWGIIKSHCYLGGIFAMQFTPDGNELLLAGMGPMRDPMAGNGKQLWQKWDWQAVDPKRVGQTHEGESGEGLMETLAVHPSGKSFVMGGRLRGGDWNLAMFEIESGNRIASAKLGYRATQALFTRDGTRLVVVGSQGQPTKKEKDKFPDFGRVDVLEIEEDS